MQTTRRTLLKSTLLTAAASTLSSPLHAAPPKNLLTPTPTTFPSTPPLGHDRFRGLKVGVATYTFRLIPLLPTIAGIRRVGVAYCSIKDSHLPLKSSAEQRKKVSDQFRNAGITPLSCGNIAIHSDADARQAFEYARDASIPTIVCAPTKEMLPTLNKLVQEFDIKIAIHNHGPGDKFPSPYDIYPLLQDLDPRMGLCIDIGHTSRAGTDPAEAIRKCANRVFDCHFKDLTVKGPKSPVCEVGRGVLNIPDIARALLDINMPGHIGFEYEKDSTEPLPGLAESVGNLRGVFATLPA